MIRVNHCVDPEVTDADGGEGPASGHGRAGQREGPVSQSGVTLLELLVTITIIMVLASVAMPLSKVSGKRTKEIELRQELRTVRAAIDAFKFDWNRDGDLLLGPLCINNKLTCKEASGVSGYPKSLQTLLEGKRTGEKATVKGGTPNGTRRRIPGDPLTGKADWLCRGVPGPP